MEYFNLFIELRLTTLIELWFNITQATNKTTQQQTILAAKPDRCRGRVQALRADGGCEESDV